MDGKPFWYVDKRVIYVQLPKEVTNADLINQLNEEQIAMLDVGEKPVHILTDMRYIRQDIVQFTNIGQLRRIESMSKLFEHPNIGRTVVITDSALIRFVSKIVTHMFRADFNITESVEEAYGDLVRSDPDLANLEHLTIEEVNTHLQ